jgi:hypothetical protein
MLERDFASLFEAAKGRQCNAGSLGQARLLQILSDPGAANTIGDKPLGCEGR